MLSIRNNALAFLSLIVIMFVGLQIANATEVTGTLSSDGSSETSEGSLGDNEVQNSASAQNNGQLQGVVTGGREDSAAVSMADTALSALIWVVPVLAVIFVALLYFFKRREEI